MVAHARAQAFALVLQHIVEPVVQHVCTCYCKKLNVNTRCFSCLHANMFKWWRMFESWRVYLSFNIQWNPLHDTYVHFITTNLMCKGGILAVCSPACSNGGTCSAPNSCTCPSTYSGATCTTRMHTLHYKKSNVKRRYFSCLFSCLSKRWNMFEPRYLHLSFNI